MITATEAKNLTEDTLQNYTSDNLETIGQLIRRYAQEGQYKMPYTGDLSDIEREVLLSAGYEIVTTRNDKPICIRWK
jgi:transcription termination factor NusB